MSCYQYIRLAKRPYITYHHQGICRDNESFCNPGMIRDVRNFSWNPKPPNLGRHNCHVIVAGS